MKKLLFIFVLAGLVFSTNACKKKEKSCDNDKPKLYGAGTWKPAKIFDAISGQDLTNSSTPGVTCSKTDEIILAETQDGTSWKFPLVYQGQCVTLDLDITSWAENYGKKKLYVSNTDGTNDYTDVFEFVDEDTFKLTKVGVYNGAGDPNNEFYTIEYDKQ